MLNPAATFPITISGVDQWTAEKVKDLLEEGYTTDLFKVARALEQLIARSNLRCKQVDDYIRIFKPQYFRKIEMLKRSSREWEAASELDREDLLAGFSQQAIQSLDIVPGVGDLNVLFECEPSDPTIDDALIDRFGFEALELYLRYASKPRRVHLIPAQHHDRLSFEKLVDAGLAIRGQDIPLVDILELLTLKELQELAAGLNPPSFRRKKDAIEFLANVPDAKDRARKIIALRGVFQLKPLPEEFSRIDLDALSDAWAFAFEVAVLIAHTYVAAGYASETVTRGELGPSYIRGWTVLADETSCAYCKRAAERTYPTSKPPSVPLHIGCRCSVLALPPRQ